MKESKASISIHNIGVQRGFGIFDLFRGRGGRPTFLEDHLDRFDRSQRFLRLNRQILKDEIRQAVADLQHKNGFLESTFKLILLGDGSETLPALEPLFYITNSDISNHNTVDSSNVILYEYQREYPQIKSINYLTSNHLHRQKNAAGAIDVVYHNEDLITEASRSNIFIVKDGVLITPKSNILEGITRKKILSFAEEIMPVSIKNVTVDMFINADEVFITSTLKEVLPVVKIGSERVGDGRIGSFAKKISKQFLDHLNQ